MSIMMWQQRIGCRLPPKHTLINKFEVKADDYEGIDESFNLSYPDIRTINELGFYFDIYVPNEFFPTTTNETSNFLEDRKILYGPYRYHLTRVNTASCFNGIDISSYNSTPYLVKCVYEYLDSSTINEEELSPTIQFHTAAENKLDYIVKGEFQTYNGDGYAINLYPHNTTSDMAREEFRSHREKGFDDPGARQLIISFTIYSYDMDLWAYVITLIEKSVDGSIVPSFPDVVCFRPNKFESPIEIFFLIFDCIKVLCILGFSTFCIVRCCIQYFRKRKNLSSKLSTILWNLFTFAVTITYCVFHFHTVKNTEELLEIAAERDIETYMDLYTAKQYHYTAINIEGFILLFQGIIIVRFLRIIPSFQFFLRIIDAAIKSLISIFGFLFLVLLSFSVVATNIWGTRLLGFKEVKSAFIYILLKFEMRLNGYQLQLYDNRLDSEERVAGNFLIFFCFLIVISLYISTAVVFSAYNRIYLKHEKGRKKIYEKGKLHHYIIWLKNFLVFKRLKDKCTRKRRNRDDDDNFEDNKALDAIRNINVNNR